MTNKHESVKINEFSPFRRDIVTTPSAPTGDPNGYSTSFYPSLSPPPAQMATQIDQYHIYTGVDGKHYASSVGTNGTLPMQARNDTSYEMERYAGNYKINKIGEYIKYLDAEIKDRERLKKGYGKFDKTLFGVECTCMVTELGITGTSFFIPPLILISTPVCLGLTLVSAVLRNGSKLLTGKIDKHSAIELLARSKRNSIDEKYTKAMEDGVISDAEFQDIRKEISNYDDMKKTILNEFKKGGRQTSELIKKLKCC